MGRYDRDARNRFWYGGGGMDDGDSDVEFGYSAGGFGRGNYGGRSEPGGRGWGRARRGPGSDLQFGNWGERSGLTGRGRGEYDRGYRGAPRPEPARYGDDFRRGGQGGRTHFTGMESNRYRGVYGSGLTARDREWDDSHGGYRGTGWNRGGGMNPGRRGGW